MNSFYEENFEESYPLGSGGYSTVFKSLCKKDQQYYAIKKVPFAERSRITTLKEIEFLEKLDQKYIVSYFDHWDELNYYNSKSIKKNHYNKIFKNKDKENLLHIQMDLCPMSLYDFIQRSKNKTENTMAVKHFRLVYLIFTQLLQCLDYLHDNDIIHRDIKPHNVMLVHQTEDRIVKLTDFGIATYHYVSDMKHTLYQGTKNYRAPEVSDYDEYDTKADIYSLGMTIKEMFNINVNSWDKRNHYEITEFNEIYESTSKLILNCVDHIPNKRADCKQLITESCKNRVIINFDYSMFDQYMERTNEKLFTLYCQKWPMFCNLNFQQLLSYTKIAVFEELELKAIFDTELDEIFTCTVGDYVNTTSIKVKPSRIYMYKDENMNNSKTEKSPKILSVASGYAHALMYTDDIKVYSLGSNSYGQLGISCASNTKFQIITELENQRITKLKCGGFFSLALTKEGKLFSWGAGFYCQHGHGHANKQPVPKCLMSQVIISDISCGFSHSLAISTSRELYAWGSNKEGQLGLGDYNNRKKPEVVRFDKNIIIKTIGCGHSHSLVLTKFGELYCFGSNKLGQCGAINKSSIAKPMKLVIRIKISENEYREEKFDDIYASYDNSISISVTTNKRYYIWGETKHLCIFNPLEIEYHSYSTLEDVYLTYSKDYVINNTVFRDKSGQVFKRVLNEKLDKITDERKTRIRSISFFKLKECKAIIATDSKNIYTYRVSRSFIDETDPVLINEFSMEELKCIRIGINFVLCLTSSSKVLSFGCNEYLQLGNESQLGNFQPKIIEFFSDKQIIDICCGAYHCLALSLTGKLYSFGANYYGQLGNQSNLESKTPSEIKFDNKSVEIESIACGKLFCLALARNGELYGWGNNDYGQLGLDNTIYHQISYNQPVFIDISKHIKIKKISCGQNHSLLLTKNNELYSVGQNNFGQLGLNDKIDRFIFTPVKLEEVVDIKASFCDDISAALTKKHFFNWGRCGDIITFPVKTSLDSFNEIFITYSRQKFTTAHDF